MGSFKTEFIALVFKCKCRVSSSLVVELDSLEEKGDSLTTTNAGGSNAVLQLLAPGKTSGMYYNML